MIPSRTPGWWRKKEMRSSVPGCGWWRKKEMRRRERVGPMGGERKKEEREGDRRLTVGYFCMQRIAGVPRGSPGGWVWHGYGREIFCLIRRKTRSWGE